jgi:hypothetical protein
VDSASPARAPGARPFYLVAAVFGALLAVGLALGFVVYKRYVAYLPTVAQHVPPDVNAAVRVDLNHVMLYAPFRTWILPVANWGSDVLPPRAERLSTRGVRLGADVRELLVALGPAPGDWVLLVGGQLHAGAADALAGVLREEGRAVEARPDGGFSLGSWCFAQAVDRTVVLASSDERLQRALETRPVDEVLSRAGGALLLKPAWLGAPFRSIRGSVRAGSVVAVDVRAEFSDARAGGAALRSLLARLARLDPVLDSPVRKIQLQPTPTGMTFRLNLPSEAVERLAALVAARLSERLAQTP